MIFSRLSKAITRRSILYNAFYPPSQKIPSRYSIYKRLSSNIRLSEDSSPFRSDNCKMYDVKVSQNKTDSTSESLKSSFYFITLRDSCSCSCCVNPSTNQKLFETAAIPESIQGHISRKNPDGTVTVSWQNDVPGYDNHLSTYPGHFIEKITSDSTSTSHLESRHTPLILWDQEIMTTCSGPSDYNAFICSASMLYRTLVQLQKIGLVFLCNVPSQPDAINCIANRIGVIRNTIYGSTWNVRSVPSPKNIAYTSMNLCFHMVRHS